MEAEEIKQGGQETPTNDKRNEPLELSPGEAIRDDSSYTIAEKEGGASMQANLDKMKLQFQCESSATDAAKSKLLNDGLSPGENSLKQETHADEVEPEFKNKTVATNEATTHPTQYDKAESGLENESVDTDGTKIKQFENHLSLTDSPEDKATDETKSEQLRNALSHKAESPETLASGVDNTEKIQNNLLHAEDRSRTPHVDQTARNSVTTLANKEHVDSKLTHKDDSSEKLHTEETKHDQLKYTLSPIQESPGNLTIDVNEGEQFDYKQSHTEELPQNTYHGVKSNEEFENDLSHMQNSPESIDTVTTKNKQVENKISHTQDSPENITTDVAKHEEIENHLPSMGKKSDCNSDSLTGTLQESVKNQPHDVLCMVNEANVNTTVDGGSHHDESMNDKPAEVILEKGLGSNSGDTTVLEADVGGHGQDYDHASGDHIVNKTQALDNKVEMSDSISPPLISIYSDYRSNKTKLTEQDVDQERPSTSTQENINNDAVGEGVKVEDDTSDAIVVPVHELLSESNNDDTQIHIISDDNSQSQQNVRSSFKGRQNDAQYAESSADRENEQTNHHFEESDTVTEMKLGKSHSMYFTGRLPTLDVSESVTPYAEANDKSSNKETTPHCETFDEGEKMQNIERDSIEKSNTLQNEVDDEHIQSKKEIDKSTKEETKRLSTPSREIQKIIQEINAPAQLYRLSKEKPLTPRDRENANAGLSDLSENEEEIDFKNVTVNDLNVVTSEIMIEDSEKQSVAKYDDLPHMKKIIEYTVENHLRDTEQSDTTRDNDPVTVTAPITRTVTEISEGTCPKEKTSSVREDDTASTNFEIEQTALVNKQTTNAHEEMANKTTHSESDLKEIIASAKRARGETETVTESVTDIVSDATSTLHSSTQGAWKTDETSTGSTHDGLICSRCLRLDSDFNSSGFCYDCQEYLCGQCRKIHKESPESMYHYIMDSYCTNELKVKKYIRATSYCKDCEKFLCGKCTVQHSGFRAFRHHNVLQSSFFSRQPQSKMSSVSPQSMSLDETDNTDDSEIHTPRSETKDMRKRRHRKYIFEKQANNPYGFKFDSVSSSLYPGKNKKIAVSYTSSPKWPISSIPALPYLVKPGNLHQSALKNTYLTTQKTPLNTRSKKGRETNSLKLKVLQARYNVEPQRKNFRRKEAALYTARPLKSTEGVSLPDISSIHSYNMSDSQSSSGRTVHKKVEKLKPLQASNKLKKAEFIREECLSIPFPSDELPCLIGGMEILFDGRLVVLDKRNNNIKLFSRNFNCKASLQFQNRIVEISASSIYPTDVYLATPKHIYEISVKKGMEITRKIKVEIKRIEGLRCWKYGIAVISMKSDLSWEVRLLDFRGNLKSKLEILNPFTCEIEKSNRYHMTASKGGKYLTISDNKNACAICVDVTTRCVVSETIMSENKKPGFLAADHQNNVYVSCGDEVQQVSTKGNNLGVVVRLEKEKTGRVGCIAYNTSNDRLYVQIRSDVIAIYEMSA